MRQERETYKKERRMTQEERDILQSMDADRSDKTETNVQKHRENNLKQYSYG